MSPREYKKANGDTLLRCSVCGRLRTEGSCAVCPHTGVQKRYGGGKPCRVCCYCCQKCKLAYWQEGSVACTLIRDAMRAQREEKQRDKLARARAKRDGEGNLEQLSLLNVGGRRPPDHRDP